VSHQTKETGWTYTPTRQRNHAEAKAVRLGNAAGRREDFTWLREEQGLTIEQAADRLGVSFRVAQRYEAARKRATP
jgi:DNA-binding transcriptional regulator YiaG